MVSNAELREMARAERRDIVTLLRKLTPEQWEHPSLCEGWSVKDVAGHVVLRFPARTVWRLLLSFPRVNVHRTNEINVEVLRGYSAEQILAWFERSPDRVGATTIYPPLALRALVIHHQDMRRPLGLPPTTPPQRAAAALEAVITRVSRNLGSRERAAGLRVRATDVDWLFGDGPEVSGTAEAILMAVSGRPHSLPELSGEGVATLAARVG